MRCPPIRFRCLVQAFRALRLHRGAIPLVTVLTLLPILVHALVGANTSTAQGGNDHLNIARRDQFPNEASLVFRQLSVGLASQKTGWLQTMKSKLQLYS